LPTCPLKIGSKLQKHTIIDFQAPGRALIPRPPEIQTIPSSAMNSIRIASDTPSISPRLAQRTAPLPPHPLPVGARIAAVAPLMSNQTSTLPVKRRPGPSSDIITLSDDEPGPSAAKRAAPSSLPVAPSPLTLKKPTDSANRCKVRFVMLECRLLKFSHCMSFTGMAW
ncbi:hypothetical protein COOONC_07785, partial [Cooperia oncophora]